MRKPWAKIPMRIWSDPGLVGLSPIAQLLYLKSWAYCAEHKTDGRIPFAAVRTIEPKARAKHLKELSDAAHFVSTTVSGQCFYVLSDFLEYNPSTTKRSRISNNQRDRRLTKRCQNGTANALSPVVMSGRHLHEMSTEEAGALGPVERCWEYYRMMWWCKTGADPTLSSEATERLSQLLAQHPERRVLEAVYVAFTTPAERLPWPLSDGSLPTPSRFFRCFDELVPKASSETDALKAKILSDERMQLAHERLRDLMRPRGGERQLDKPRGA